MKNIKLFLISFLFVALSVPCGLIAKARKDKPSFGIVIHGGAGVILKKNMSTKEDEQYRAKLKEAMEAGYKLLAGGSPALDAVQKAVNILEDSPLFNAGRGAVFNSEGKNEMDASIMDGRTLNAGAVSGVSRVRNPIDLARLIMDKSKHVMLSGEGAEKFGIEHEIGFAGKKYFYTKKRWEQLKKRQKEEKNKEDAFFSKASKDKYGTVGAVALDSYGNLAAATSTGGLTNKRFGRVGDSPIIGAGTYAKNATCAISATGTGEFFIRGVIAHDISALMEYRNRSLNSAARHVIMKKLTAMGGDGGVIGIDKNGNVAMVFNTEGMYRGYHLSRGKPVIKIYKD